MRFAALTTSYSLIYPFMQPGTVFAANIIGSASNGRAGVWRSVDGQLQTLLYEEPPTLPSSVDTIWTAHANLSGEVAFHVRLADQSQAILVLPAGDQLRFALRSGQQVTVGPGDVRTIDSFWTLGGTFGGDPVVTGSGLDGIQSAVTRYGDMALVVLYGSSAGTPGTAVIYEEIVPELFADGFET